MATKGCVVAAMESLVVAFPSYRKSDALRDVLMDALDPYADEDVERAVRRLIATQTRAPAVADLVGAASAISASKAALAAHNQSAHYPTYWERPEWERREIDAARVEFHRVWNALQAGASVFDLFPADSAPCRLAREMQQKCASEPSATRSAEPDRVPAPWD
jgi:hypothetical protein